MDWLPYSRPPPAPPRPCPWYREAFKLRLLTFLTACCGASRCAVDVVVAVAEKANKPNVLRIIIFAVRRTRINISTVASPSHCAPCTHKAVSAGRSMGGGWQGEATLVPGSSSNACGLSCSAHLSRSPRRARDKTKLISCCTERNC